MATTETIIAATLFALVGVVILALPFFRREDEAPSGDDLARLHLETLQVYYQQILTTMRDLDEDFATHKMNADDYEAERELWAARGVKVLDAIQQVEARDENDAPQVAPEPAPQMDDDDIDAAIEAAVQRALGAK